MDYEELEEITARHRRLDILERSVIQVSQRLERLQDTMTESAIFRHQIEELKSMSAKHALLIEELRLYRAKTMGWMAAVGFFSSGVGWLLVKVLVGASK